MIVDRGVVEYASAKTDEDRAKGAAFEKIETFQRLVLTPISIFCSVPEAPQRILIRPLAKNILSNIGSGTDITWRLNCGIWEIPEQAIGIIGAGRVGTPGGSNCRQPLSREIRTALKLIDMRQKPYPARGDQYVGSGEPKR